MLSLVLCPPGEVAGAYPSLFLPKSLKNTILRLIFFPPQHQCTRGGHPVTKEGPGRTWATFFQVWLDKSRRREGPAGLEMRRDAF